MKLYLGLLIATLFLGCTSIHHSWQVTFIRMDGTDSTTLSMLLQDSIVYTFEKDGMDTYFLGGTSAAGTYQYMRRVDSLLTTENGISDSYRTELSRRTMIISKGIDSILFKRID